MAISRRFYETIDEDADFYQPSVYNLLSFYHNLQQESDELDGQFIPMTTVQPWEQERALFFAVGILPPPANVTDKLLDRSASIDTYDEIDYETLIDENPDVSSSSTGDLPGQTSGISTSTTIPNGPTSTNSTDFWVQFVAMCNRLGCQPEELARVIQSESGFNPAAQYRRTPEGPATAKGLIQFIRPTARNVGMTDEEYDNLQNTSATEQLQWVEAFYEGRAKGKNAFELKAVTLGGFNNPDGSIYNLNARELGYNNPTKQEQAYLANQQFDAPPPPKGFITPVDRNQRLAKKPLRQSILNKITGARRELGMQTDYVSFQPDARSSPGWQSDGSDNANVASKTSAQVAGTTDLNQTNLGKQFQAAQLAQKAVVRAALQQMADTPPLRLLVNPKQFRVAAEKIISDGNWGRNGPIIEHWGENQDTIEGSGKIAAFYSLDASEGNSPGLSRTARQFSASYQNLLSLWLIYKNNGGVYLDDPLVPTGSRKKNLSIVGSVYLYYDHTLYIGSFDTFSLTESETEPFSLEYNFSFKVRATFLLDHLDDPQYTYGQPTSPALPTSTTGTLPLTGGNNEQPAPAVEPPPENDESSLNLNPNDPLDLLG